MNRAVKRLQTVASLDEVSMNVIILTPIRMLGDGLALSIGTTPPFRVVAVVADLAAMKGVLTQGDAHVALIDVTQSVDLLDIKAVATQWPDIPLVALGLVEQQHEVVKCGRAGFAGYISRDSSIDTLCERIAHIAQGRLTCSPEISSGLLRALFRVDTAAENAHINPPLTRRESEVLSLLGNGLSNKEIGATLNLSIATVKHHVHHVLDKLQLPRRADAMRRVRDAPWLAATHTVTASKRG
jgi:two-component system, NarL family, nitrate/nitrite response regulator NarL